MANQIISTGNPAVILQMAGMANQGPQGPPGPTGPAGGGTTGTMSITGSANVSLVNDLSNPGNSMLYGTSASGVPGWFPQPTGGISTGAMSITGTATLSLVGDSASPGNSYVYGTNGSGVKGWQAVSGLSFAWSQITSGVPSSFNPSGNLNTQYSIAGGAGFATSPTINLVNDVASPTNGQFYGVSGGVRGWFTPSTSGVTGQQSITGTTTLNLVNDVTTPTNGQFYGYSSGARGWFTPAGGGDVSHTRLVSTQYSITGGGDLSADRTHNLVNDVATPTNGQFYGYVGSARGWFTPANVASGTAGYAPASGGGTTNYLRADGSWTAPPGTLTASQSTVISAGNLTLTGDTASPGNTMLYGTNSGGTRGWYAQPVASTGSQSVTGTATMTLVNDSASPGNSMLYGTNSGGTRGWYAQPVVSQTIAKFHASDGNSPATNYAYWGTRDTGSLDVWQFAHSGTDTSIIFPDVVPQGVTWATGLKAVLYWASTSANSGAAEWQASVDNVNSHSIDTDSYGTGVSQITTTNGTAAVMNTTTISIPTANLQSLAAEQPYKLKITRRASDTSNDTMADVASLWMVEVKTY